MDEVLLGLKKRVLLPVVFLAGFAVWLIVCEGLWRSYWLGTIYRVQTTDFNLLHHTLPTTLSQLIITGRDDEVQKVLNSTYGIFGLVVTDPSGQTILYKTNKTYHKKSWQLTVDPDELAKSGAEPFDVLTDPPPVEAMYEHKSPRSEAATRLPVEPRGRVLGRIYYLRQPPPSFLDDITSFFFTGPWEMSGSKRDYLLLSICTVLFSVATVLLVWLRRRGLEMKQKELEHAERELEIRKKALEHLSAELDHQKTRKSWLEKEAEKSYKRALRLKESLEKLKESLGWGALAVPAGPAETFSPQDTSQSVNTIKIRPPMHPPSVVLDEIEELIPALTDNASALKSQAGLLNDYCSWLENRQEEMKRMVESAYPPQQQGANEVFDMRPG